MTYRVIVTGCRDWDDQASVSLALGSLLIERRFTLGPETPVDLKIVHGASYPKPLPDGSRPLVSADWLAELWARDCDVPSEENFANWRAHQKSAGPIRNSAMVAAGADLCIAFWDGKSSGTLDCFTKAVRAGIPVRIVAKVPMTDRSLRAQVSSKRAAGELGRKAK